MADPDIDFLEQWVLLAVWRLQPNANTVLISEKIKKCTGRKYGNIYTRLYSLEKKGFIKRPPSHELIAAGRVRKHPKIVKLTEQGRRTLEEWLRAIDLLRHGTKKTPRKRT